MPNNVTPYRADHVGSFLRPPKLKVARERHKKGEINAAALRAVEDECIREVVREQQDIGLQLVTDGEYRRAWYHADFLTQIQGVLIRNGTFPMSFKRPDGNVSFIPQDITIGGKLRRTKPIQLDDFKYLQSVAKVTSKVCIPSPAWLYIRSGRQHIAQDAYPDMDEFAADLSRVYAEEVADLAAAGCTRLQLDETNFALLCDENLREAARKNGRDPVALVRSGIGIINNLVASAPKSISIGVHSCRGNYRSAWISAGGYDAVAEMLFNELRVDTFYLEYDDERSGELSPLRFVPKGKTVVLGFVTTKLAQLESKDALKRRIDEAAKYMPLDQICLSPQCGFSSTEEGNELSIDEQWAKMRLVVEVAREVWA
ncbi:MAG: 5-methyltetrahydropteroyltriglutamate--homocysteine S-methyltransferase [Betaproteobacteria bacterium]|nr:5-methyltetrahydropteroyltriglutamate--homocysteine S-methyltransferase [Betaproteobacteria bacterium]